MLVEDREFHLANQYVELTRTTPRQLAEASHGECASEAGMTGALAPSSPEAEHSLRRIERRLGSIA